MNLTMLNAASVMKRCARFTALSVSRLRVMDFIRLISKMTRPSSRTYADVLDAFGTLSARSHQGFRASLKGLACSVVAVIGISLSIAEASSSEASIVPIKLLANKQLTNKQYLCHNEIIFRESSWNINAVNGSHHGYYQLKIKAVKGKPYDYQFWMYWYYVAKRYGVTQYDEPNYCNALHHLKTRGWQ